jgi:hypothetical protein
MKFLVEVILTFPSGNVLHANKNVQAESREEALETGEKIIQQSLDLAFKHFAGVPEFEEWWEQVEREVTVTRVHEA